MKEIKLTINNKEISASADQTILESALNNGIQIPRLCYDKRISPTGACRLCIVEIEGRPGVHTSCTLKAAEGMVVNTNSENIRSLRKTILELLLSEHDITCTTCDMDGSCFLQDFSYEYGVDEKMFPSIVKKDYGFNYASKDKGIIYSPGKCIRCQRCVKTCEEVQQVSALTLKGRAGDVLVTSGFNVDLKKTTCELCGQCIGTCPTGALYERPASGKGRAVNITKVRTTCPFCGVGCQMDLNVNRKTGKIVRVTSPTGIIPNDGNLCIKGRFGMDYIASPDRLTKPLIKENGTFREASWDEAIDLTASKFMELKKKYGSDALAGLSSAKTINEDNYIMQKFVRAVFGTNNVDHCARLCHASTVAGLARAFGSGAMTNSIEELGRAPLIFVIGSNTTDCHPVIGINIRRAVAEGRTKLIVADPRKISLTGISDIHMRQKSGSDVALINAMMNVIISEGLADNTFIKERTEEYEAMKNAVAQCPPEAAESITGVPAGEIRKAARMYASAEAASIVYSMGITQHITGTDNVLSLANLSMLTGNIGKECAGVNPLRGQNNVQGACDMGALPNVYNGYQKVDLPEINAKFEKAWNTSLSDKPGLTVVEIMNAASDKKVRGLYIMGENPMLSDPDINHVKEGLETLDFLVVQDIFLTETALLADVVFPAAAFAEKDGTFTNTERRVQRIRKAVEAPGEAREDWRIICDVASKMGYKMSYPDVSAIQDEIAEVTPIYGGILYDRLEGVGLQWPCPDREHNGTKFLHKGKFSRGTGKFHAVTVIPPKEQTDSDYPFVLTTGRLLEHWHTGTMTRRSEVIDDRVPHGAIELNPADAEKIAVRHGESVVVKSRRGRIEIPVEVTEKVEAGTTFLAFHFAEHPANMLTIAALDPIAKIPELKVCAVSIEKL